MEKISKIAIVTGVALLFVGCTQPEFNPGNKTIVFKNGKPYRIPYNVGYGNFISNSNDLKFYTDRGARNCRIGDVVWIHTSEKQRRVTTNQEADNMYIQAAREGRLGCAHPLNQQEYNYYVNQQNQRSANNRAAAQSQAASDQAYYNNINNSANQQIQQRNENFYRDNYILNRAGY